MMDAAVTVGQRTHKSRSSTAQLARIDQWVAEQLNKPWPLSCAQLDLIRRALASRRGAG
ncbi:MAG: hypothetical protein ACRDR6_28895 [Pseudonocardiaceae bacterium]